MSSQRPGPFDDIDGDPRGHLLLDIAFVERERRRSQPAPEPVEENDGTEDRRS